MKINRIRNAASILELFIFGTIVWCGGSPRLILSGILYLIAAVFLALFCVSLATGLHLRQRRSTPEPAAWSLHRRAYILLLSAWEVAIIGLLNMLTLVRPASWLFTLSYLMAGISIVLSYKMVALADSSLQDGGSMPLSYFGRPRSRRLLFCCFVYTPISMLAFAGIVIRLSWKWCPVPFQPPQLCLLLIALSSAMAAGMALHRYRTSASHKALAVRIFGVTLFGLVCTGIMVVIFAYSIYAGGRPFRVPDRHSTSRISGGPSLRLRQGRYILPGSTSLGDTIPKRNLSHPSFTRTNPASPSA